MNKLVRLVIGDRRRGAQRLPARRTVHLFNGATLIGVARILDESDGGFRIAPGADGRRLPDAFTLLEVETALAHEVGVAWRTASELGLRVKSEQRLRGFVPPHYQMLKAFWETAAVLTE